METSENSGVSIFLNKAVILWVLESDLKRPKAKFGKLLSIDHTHIIIEFTQGPLTGQRKAYLRSTIQRIDLDLRGDALG